MFKKFWAWIKKHVLRRQKKELEKEIREYDEQWLATLKKKPLLVPKPGHQATRQDIGKWMKHGRQAPWYRRSVKEKKKIDEND